MTRYSGMQIREKMPRRTWFRIPVEVRKAYPDAKDYEIYNMNASINGILNKDLKWGTVIKQKSGNQIYWCI